MAHVQRGDDECELLKVELFFDQRPDGMTASMRSSRLRILTLRPDQGELDVSAAAVNRLEPYEQMPAGHG